MLLIIISIALLQLFPLSITGVKHRLLPQLSNAIFDAASLCQLVFICHCLIFLVIHHCWQTPAASHCHLLL
jgi:hypothetical protein